MGGQGQPSTQGSGMQNLLILLGGCGISCWPLLQQAELCLPSWLPALHLGVFTKSPLQAVCLCLAGLSLSSHRHLWFFHGWLDYSLQPHPQSFCFFPLVFLKST